MEPEVLETTRANSTLQERDVTSRRVSCTHSCVKKHHVLAYSADRRAREGSAQNGNSAALAARGGISWPVSYGVVIPTHSVQDTRIPLAVLETKYTRTRILNAHFKESYCPAFLIEVRSMYGCSGRKRSFLSRMRSTTRNKEARGEMLYRYQTGLLYPRECAQYMV